MNEQKDEHPEDAAAPDAAAAGDQDGKEKSAETPWAGTAESEAAPGPAAQLAGENAKLKDQLLRTLADMENLRRRTEREISDARSYAIASFARDMLGVSDNLRRALDALPADAREGGDATLKTLLEGVELTERELLNTLAKHKVTRIDPAGERFDPNFHQAMFEVPNPDVPSGTVVQVVQAGYVIGERVLRPAMVGVSKGGPKPAPKGEPEASAQGPAEPKDKPADPAAQTAQKSYAGEQSKGTHYDTSA